MRTRTGLRPALEYDVRVVLGLILVVFGMCVGVVICLEEAEAEAKKNLTPCFQLPAYSLGEAVETVETVEVNAQTNEEVVTTTTREIPMLFVRGDTVVLIIAA